MASKRLKELLEARKSSPRESSGKCFFFELVFFKIYDTLIVFCPVQLIPMDMHRLGR